MTAQAKFTQADIKRAAASRIALALIIANEIRGAAMVAVFIKEVFRG
jgi:hypothetical protein